MFWVHFEDGSLEYIPGVVHNEQYKKGEFSFLELDGRPAKNPFK